MSEDFDKSDSPTGIDFHEAERLFILAFEAKYPAFIAYFNTRITGSGLSTTLWIQYKIDRISRRWNISGFSGLAPDPTEVANYAEKIGYDAVNYPRHPTMGPAVNIDWTRRDACRWGS